MSVADAGAPPPLVVDLDHTLVRSDTLVECLVRIAFSAPLSLARVAGRLLGGRAEFKAAAAREAALDCRALPYDEGVLELVHERRAAGGEVHLVTAADHTIAEAVASRLGVFDSWIGSEGGRNLKGREKARALARQFPDGFGYVGDCAADIPVWKAATEVVVARPARGLMRRLARHGLAVDRELHRPRPGARDWVRALRIHQWSKNALLFVPLLLAQQFMDANAGLEVLGAFLAFGCTASATYVLNDMSDLAADRAHPTKRRRPLASGLIGLPEAGAVAALLLTGGLSAAFLLDREFGLACLGYTAVTLLYSFKLKRVALFDVLVIGGLFGLRITAGMLILDQPLSMWLISFTAVLFTALAMVKRHSELIEAAGSGRGISGRDYLVSDAPLTAAVGVSASTASTLVMLLYMELEAVQTGLYREVGYLFLMPAVLASWLLRLWSRAHRGRLHDDPVIFALKDKVSWVHAGAVVLLWALAVFPSPLP